MIWAAWPAGGGGREGARRTTMSESLGLDVVAEKARMCGLGAAALLAERAAVRNSMGAILDAIVGVVVVGNRKENVLRCWGKSMSSNVWVQLREWKVPCNLRSRLAVRCAATQSLSS